jgi:hypothetical protein
MAVEILGDDNQAAMFCNTSMFAFGPVLSSREEAEAFRQYCYDNIGDPRTTDDTELIRLLGLFHEEYPEHNIEL